MEARPAVTTRARRVTACQRNHSRWQVEIEGIPLLESMMTVYSAGTIVFCNVCSCRKNFPCVQAWHDAWRLSCTNVQREHRLKDWYKISPMTADLLQWS